MRRATLERYQVWWYLGAAGSGLAIGSRWPQAGHPSEALVWPVLALLLFATFTQVPVRSIPAAVRDVRFLTAALVGNFLLVPGVVWLLVRLTPDDEALRLGLYLVLLVPCTDWFITFTQLGRGDAGRATAFTPVSLVVQLALLPAYLWLLADADLTSVFTPADVWPALVVVLAPLGLAALTQLWCARRPGRERVVERLGWWPVPLLSIVIALVAAANVGAIGGALPLLPVVAAVTAGFLVVSLALAKLLAMATGLPVEQGRTLAFSMGTRNSFIVLPFALSLPAGWEVTAIVIVMQSLVELFGMIAYLWLVPRVVFPGSRG